MTNGQMLQAVYDAAKDFADYHADYETADLQAIANGGADAYHTDKTARIILAVRAHEQEPSR